MAFLNKLEKKKMQEKKLVLLGKSNIMMSHDHAKDIQIKEYGAAMF